MTADILGITPESPVPLTGPRPTPNRSRVEIVIILLAAVCFLTWFGGTATAQPAGKSPPKAAKTPASQVSKAPVSAARRWHVKKEEDAMGRGLVVSAEVEADDAYGVYRWGRFAGNFRPELGFQCRNGKTDAYVSVGVTVRFEGVEGGASQVTARIDDGEPLAQIWMRSSDGETLFFYDTLVDDGAVFGAISLGRQLAEAHRRLLFEFHPASGSAQIVKFTLNGASAALKVVSAACKWDEVVEGEDK